MRVLDQGVFGLFHPWRFHSNYPDRYESKPWTYWGLVLHAGVLGTSRHRIKFCQYSVPQMGASGLSIQQKKLAGTVA